MTANWRLPRGVVAEYERTGSSFDADAWIIGRISMEPYAGHARPGLSPRDRSLITVASLVTLYRVNELPFHLNKALDNGITKDELIDLITHLAFYSGWPTANTALTIARRVFEGRKF